MMKQIKSLRNPPLTEVAFGLQFNGVFLNSSEVFKLYNSHFFKDYPVIQEQDKLPNIIEGINNSSIKLFNSKESRKQFIHKNDDKVIQVQPDKIIFNWRRGMNQKTYPHYNQLYQQFNDEILDIEEVKEKLKEVNQLELTYFDHIENSEFKLNSYKIDSIFSWLNIPGELNNVNFSFTRFKEEINGNLHLKINSAVRNSDKKPIIVIETTVRGNPKESMSIEDWFLKARKIIVDLFFDAISNENIEKWNS